MIIVKALGPRKHQSHGQDRRSHRRMLISMTTTHQYDKRNFKAFEHSEDEEIQLNWIKGLIDQIEFANKPDVLPDFVLNLRIARRYRE